MKFLEAADINPIDPRRPVALPEPRRGKGGYTSLIPKGWMKKPIQVRLSMWKDRTRQAK